MEMNKDQKLVDDIATLLRAAGYVGVKVLRDDAGTTLSGTRDGGGAMLRLATQMAKGPARSEVSMVEPQAERQEVLVAPAAEGMLDGLVAHPELAAVFQIPAAHLKHLS
jgi:hypothetical protein